MPDQTPAPSPAPAEPINTPSPDDALKSIASEFHVEEQAKSFTATPQPQQPNQVPFVVPDPVVDSAAYQAYAQALVQKSSQMENSIREATSKIDAFDQMFRQQKVDADVGHAVQVVNQKLKVDNDLVEALLNIEYNKNPSFKRIWENRDRNPDAYQKALGIVADKLSSKVQVRQDPQLMENVRAAKSAQQTMATMKPGNQEEVPDDPRAFDSWWHTKKRGY